jgi:hypothetical protein
VVLLNDDDEVIDLRRRADAVAASGRTLVRAPARQRGRGDDDDGER